MSTNPSLTQLGDVAGSVSSFQTAKSCSRCGGPRDRGARQRYCRACHAKNMRAWRSTHQSIAKPATFHGKPFVNPLVHCERLEIREADGLYQLLINGIPVDIGPPIECPFEAAAFLRAMRGDA